MQGSPTLPADIKTLTAHCQLAWAEHGCDLLCVVQAELQQQLSELEQLPRTTEVRQAIAAAKKELKHFRDPGQSWWRW